MTAAEPNEPDTTTTATAAAPTRPTRRWRDWVGAVTAIVAVCALAGYITYRVSGDSTVDQTSSSRDQDPATIGSSYTGLPDNDDPEFVGSVRVPSGTLHLAVYTDYSRVEDKDAKDFGRPSGGSFVGVDAVLDSRESTFPTATLNYHSPPDADVTVVADGRGYPVEGRRARPVAIRGGTAHLALQVSFDGIAQRVDLTTGKITSGRAAVLYGAPTITTQSCGTATIAAPFVVSPIGIPIGCTLTGRRVPWLPALGWAPAGSSWFVLAVSTRGPQVLDRVVGSTRTQFDVNGFETPLTIRCGDTPALEAVPGDQTRPLFAAPAGHRRDGTSYTGCRVPASGPAGVTLAVTETLMRVSGPGDSDDTSARISWTVRLS